MQDQENWQKFKKSQKNAEKWADPNEIAHQIDQSMVRRVNFAAKTTVSPAEIDACIRHANTLLKQHKHELGKINYFKTFTQGFSLAASILLGFYFGINQAIVYDQQDDIEIQALSDPFSNDIF